MTFTPIKKAVADLFLTLVVLKKSVDILVFSRGL